VASDASAVVSFAAPSNNEMQLTSGVLVGEARMRAPGIIVSPLAADLSVRRTLGVGTGE